MSPLLIKSSSFNKVVRLTVSQLVKKKWVWRQDLYEGKVAIWQIGDGVNVQKWMGALLGESSIQVSSLIQRPAKNCIYMQSSSWYRGRTLQPTYRKHGCVIVIAKSWVGSEFFYCGPPIWWFYHALYCLHSSWLALLLCTRNVKDLLNLLCSWHCFQWIVGGVSEASRGFGDMSTLKSRGVILAQ